MTVKVPSPGRCKHSINGSAVGPVLLLSCGLHPSLSFLILKTLPPWLFRGLSSCFHCHLLPPFIIHSYPSSQFSLKMSIGSCLSPTEHPLTHVESRLYPGHAHEVPASIPSHISFFARGMLAMQASFLLPYTSFLPHFLSPAASFAQNALPQDSTQVPSSHHLASPWSNRAAFPDHSGHRSLVPHSNSSVWYLVLVPSWHSSALKST